MVSAATAVWALLLASLAPLGAVAGSGCAHISCVPDSVLQGSYGGGTYYDVNGTTGVCDVITTWWGGNSVSCFIGSTQLSGFSAGSHILLAWPKTAEYSVTSVWSANAGFATVLVDDESLFLVKFAVDNDITSSIEIGFTISRDNQVKVDGATFSGFEIRTDSPFVDSAVVTAATNVEGLFSGTCKSISTFDRGNTVECSLLTVRVESYPKGTSMVLKFSKPKDVVVVGLPWSLQTDPIHFQYAQTDNQVKFVVKTDWSASRYLKIRFQVRRQNAYTLDGALFKSFVFLTDLAPASSPSVTSKTQINAKTVEDLKVNGDTPIYFKIVSKLTQSIVNSQTVDVVKVTFRSLYFGIDTPAKLTSFKIINYRSDWPVQYFNQTSNEWADLSSTTATTFQTPQTGVLVLSFRTNDLLDTAAIVMNWDFRIAEDPVFLLLKTQIAYELQRVDQDLKSNSVNQKLRTELIAQIGAGSLSDFAASYQRLTKDFLDGDPCGNTEVYVNLPEDLYVASPLTSSSCSAKTGRFRGLGLFDSVGEFFTSLGNSFVSTGNSLVSGAESFVKDKVISPAVSFGNNVQATFANLDGKLVNFVGTVISSSEFQKATQWVIQGYDGAKNFFITIGNGVAMLIKTISDGWKTFVKLVEKGVQILKELIEILFNQDDVRRTYKMLGHMLYLFFNTFETYLTSRIDEINNQIANAIDFDAVESKGLNQFEQYLSHFDDNGGIDLGIVGEAIQSIASSLDNALSVSIADFDENSILLTQGNTSTDQFDGADFPKFSSSSGTLKSSGKALSLDPSSFGKLAKNIFNAVKDVGLPDVFPFNYLNHLCSQLLGGDTCSFYNLILFAGAEVFTVSWKAANNFNAPFSADDEAYFLSLTSMTQALPFDAPSPTTAPTTTASTAPVVASFKAEASTSVAASTNTTTTSDAKTFSEFLCTGVPMTYISAAMKKIMPILQVAFGIFQALGTTLLSVYQAVLQKLPCLTAAEITPVTKSAIGIEKALKMFVSTANLFRAFPLKNFNLQHVTLIAVSALDIMSPLLDKKPLITAATAVSGILHIAQGIEASDCYAQNQQGTALAGAIMHFNQGINRIEGFMCGLVPALKKTVTESAYLTGTVYALEVVRTLSVWGMVVVQLTATALGK